MVSLWHNSPQCLLIGFALQLLSFDVYSPGAALLLGYTYNFTFIKGMQVSYKQ